MLLLLQNYRVSKFKKWYFHMGTLCLGDRFPALEVREEIRKY